MLDPDDRPRPDLPAIVRALHAHEVTWVMSGSTVAHLLGADIDPNDVDVVPSTDPENLRRLAALLAEVDAIPAYVPSWTNSLSRDECLAWRPAPPSVENLDHLFVTSLGMLDVPPYITGSYEHLAAGATTLEIGGIPVLVCDVREVLSRLPATPRAKDVARRTAYDRLRQSLGIPLPSTDEGERSRT